MYNYGAMAQFNDFIEKFDLVDLPLVGDKFTWFRNQDTVTFCKLNRFLFSVEFLEKCNKVIQIVLPISLSDHDPMLITEDEVNWGQKTFCFFNYWLDVHGFGEMLKTSWGILFGS
ncbi:hypothetical protein REPUB_Repub06bG0060200 [Reevesia pubescens]